MAANKWACYKGRLVLYLELFSILVRVISLWYAPITSSFTLDINCLFVIFLHLYKKHGNTVTRLTLSHLDFVWTFDSCTCLLLELIPSLDVKRNFYNYLLFSIYRSGIVSILYSLISFFNEDYVIKWPLLLMKMIDKKIIILVLRLFRFTLWHATFF